MEALLARLSALPISEVESRLRAYFLSLKLRSAQFKRTPSDYYDWTLEQRRNLLQAPSTFYLCKTIVMENSAFEEEYASEPWYFRYVAVIIQYEDKLNAEKVMKFMKQLQNSHVSKAKISKKHFHFRLADEGDAQRLTGYGYNATTPFLMQTNMPIILTEKVTTLQPAYFWMGGGEVELKLGMSVEEFVKVTQAYVADVSL